MILCPMPFAVPSMSLHLCLLSFHGLLGIVNIAVCFNIAAVLVEHIVEEQQISDPVFVVRGCEMF